MSNKKLAITTLLIIAISVVSIALVTSKAYAATPVFKITFICPGGSSNPTRQQFARMIAEQCKSIGIDARVEYMPWPAIYPLTLVPDPDPVTGNRGKTFDEGGFDALFVGWTFTNPFVVDPKSIFYGTETNWAPTGQNYYLWLNQTGMDLIDQFNEATNEAAKKAAGNKFQEVLYDEVPALSIVVPRQVFLVQKNMKYVDP